MNWENAAYAVLGLLGIAIGLMSAIGAWESGNDGDAVLPVILIGIGFYCLNTIRKKDEE